MKKYSHFSFDQHPSLPRRSIFSFCLESIEDNTYTAQMNSKTHR